VAQDDIAAQTAPPAPWSNFELSDITYDEVSDNGNLFRIKELIERSFFSVG
jgi:hypothetical protein